MRLAETSLYAVDWSQTIIDDVRGLDIRDIRLGSEWAWHGPALRLDGPHNVIPLGPALGWHGLRSRVANRTSRLLRGPPRTPKPPVRHPGLRVTDARDVWRVDWIERLGGGRLAVFLEGPPPNDTVLWVTDVPQQPVPGPTPLCLLPTGLADGTSVATPQGPRPIEDLRPGDRVVTPSDRAVAILATESRRLSGTRLHLDPQLRPIRLRVAKALPVFVAPGQRVAVRGRTISDLFQSDHALATAVDLLPLTEASTPPRRDAITYHTLTLETGHLFRAGGFWCQPLPPAEDASAPVSDGLATPRLLTAPEAAFLAARALQA